MRSLCGTSRMTVKSLSIAILAFFQLVRFAAAADIDGFCVRKR